jgi:hypothetical protein
MREMQSHGVTPNVISFTSLLSAGARAIKNEGDATVVQQAQFLNFFKTAVDSGVYKGCA